jgi:antitoxin PrlF
MSSKPANNSAAAIEATVTSKGQITLPKALRSHLGINTGSRIRFNLHPGGFQADRVLYDLDDLWKIADSGPKPRRAMTFEQMNEAKARRRW